MKCGRGMLRILIVCLIDGLPGRVEIVCDVPGGKCQGRVPLMCYCYVNYLEPELNNGGAHSKQFIPGSVEKAQILLNDKGMWVGIVPFFNLLLHGFCGDPILLM